MSPAQEIEQALETLHNHYDRLDLSSTAEGYRQLLEALRNGQIAVLPTEYLPPAREFERHRGQGRVTILPGHPGHCQLPGPHDPHLHLYAYRDSTGQPVTGSVECEGKPAQPAFNVITHSPPQPQVIPVPVGYCRRCGATG